MENDCKNFYDGRLCYLTFHDEGRNLVGYVCAYPHNCRDCKDYLSMYKPTDPANCTLFWREKGDPDGED